MSYFETLTEAISDNLRTLLIVAAGYAVAVHQGYAAEPTVPSLPEWWQLPAAIVASAVVVGWVIGGKIPKLLPDPNGISSSPRRVETSKAARFGN